MFPAAARRCPSSEWLRSFALKSSSCAAGRAEHRLQCIIVSRLYQDPARARNPCQDAEDADDHMDYFTHIHPLRMFIHFFTPGIFLYPFLCSAHITSPHPLLSFNPLPLFPRRFHSLGFPEIIPEPPGTSRCCAARSRRLSDDVYRRTVDEIILDQVPTNWLVAGGWIRHDARPREWLEAPSSIATAAASPPARAFLFVHAHTVSSSFLPARFFKTRLVHAEADGDDHLIVVPYLAAVYVRRHTGIKRPRLLLDIPPAWLGCSSSSISHTLGIVHLCRMFRSPFKRCVSLGA